ncbi:MAG: hypothetical protein E6R03_16015 [Hyphomicrobiaceae bacterium]|nr:MAG: hypothetical protein E6R03_16015 [Hyphomicrobiaceae bacterium]
MAVQDLSEVTPDTTSEDIAAYAKQVAEEVAAERQGEPEEKSDAQITAEHSGNIQDKTDTPAEKNSGSNTATDGGEKTGSAAGATEWLSDDVKAEAAAYGIDESELADFASREELDRALRLFDKRALEAGQKVLAEGGQARNEKGQFVKKEEPKADQAKEATPKEGRYEVGLNPDLYDEEIVSEFTRLRDHYESRFEALEAHFKQSAVIAEEKQFDNEIDKLDMPKLFGVTGKETAEELQRREDVLAQAKVLQAGLEYYGRNVPLETLVARAAPMVFASEFDKQKLKQQTRKISKQSDSRLGGSPTKPQPPSDSPADRYDRLYKEMSQS